MAYASRGTLSLSAIVASDSVSTISFLPFLLTLARLAAATLGAFLFLSILNGSSTNIIPNSLLFCLNPLVDDLVINDSHLEKS